MTSAIQVSSFMGSEQTFDVLMSTFSQEFMALMAFVFSFFLWRRLCRRERRSKAAEKLSKKVSEHESPPKSVAASFHSRSQKSAPKPAPAGGQTMTPQVQVAIKQIMRHLEQREFTRALHIYRSLERDGWDRLFDEELYSAFVQSGIRVGKTDIVERIFHNMKRNNFKPSLSLWQTTVKMQSSRKQYSSVLILQSIFGDKAPCDPIVYSCFINAALEMGEPHRAAALLEPYSKSGLTPQDHVLHFRAYVALGDADGAEALFRKLGAGTSTLMLNLLILICVNKKDTARAHQLLREGHELEDPRSNTRIVDAVSYNTIIKGYMSEEAPVKCFRCLQEMISRNIEPDDITLSTLFDSCVAEKDLGVALEVVDLMTARNTQTNTCMGTLFIKVLLKVGALPKALELHKSMKSNTDCKLDVVTYSMLIKALLDRGDLEPALQLLQEMMVAGIPPDDIVLTHLVEGCQRIGRLELGKRLFDELTTAGVKPSEFTLMAMLKLCGRCGAHADAIELVSTWQEKHGQEPPSVIHYTCVMSGCSRSKSIEQAWKAFELMISRGVSPDKTTLATLLPGLVDAGQWDRALCLVREVIKACPRNMIDAATLHNAALLMEKAAAAAENPDAAASARLHADKLRLLTKDTPKRNA